jgi:hypothetical protein
MSALLMKAGQLEIITPRQRSYLWMQMGKLGYRTNEPVPVDFERPALLHELLKIHLGELQYSDADLCSIMNCDRTELSRHYLHDRLTLVTPNADFDN